MKKQNKCKKIFKINYKICQRLLTKFKTNNNNNNMLRIFLNTIINKNNFKIKI